VPDPVEQDFTADGTEYLATLLAMSEATDKWAKGVLGDIALVQAALDAMHGKDISIGVDMGAMADAAAVLRHELPDISADLIQQTALLRDMATSMAVIQRDVADTSADAMMQTAILGEMRDMWSANATAATQSARATQDQGGSLIFATQAMSMFTIGLGVAHLLITSLGANVVADAVGITAFGIAATDAIGPVVTSLSTLTTSYGNLDNYQRAAALSLQSFLNSLGGNEAQIFTVFNQGLSLVESNMSSAGGVTSQASIAFMDFFAMLKQQFASSGWVALFSRSTSTIRSDLDALFGLLNNVTGLIPAVFHDFNGLGLGVIGFASGLLHATAAVLNFDPALTKVVAGVSLAATAWHLLGNSISWIPAMGPTLSKLGTDFVKVYQGARIAGQGIFEAGVTAAGAALPLALIGAEGIAFVAIANAMPDPIHNTIAALVQQDQAVGDNVAGYTRLSASLNEYLTHQKQLAAGISPRSLIEVAQAQQLAAGTANTLNHNFAYLNATYGLTQQQAFQLAQVTGVNLKQALTGSSQSAVEARSKIAAYEQTVNAARQVETQFAFDMQQATNSTLTWTTRLQGLSTAFSVLSGPLLGAMNAAAAFKQAQVALNQAEDQGTNIVGTATAKQAALTIAVSNAAAAAMKDSVALFNQAKETGNTATAAQIAVGPLVAMKDQILDLGLKGQAAAALVAQLNQEINALHSKTVTIQTNVVTHYSSTYAHIGAQGGNQLGTDAAQPGMAWVGEAGPELMTFAGGERVIPHQQSMAMAGGGGPAISIGDIHVHGTVIAQQDLRSVVQQAVLDAWTRNRGTGFSPYGFGLR
jgi:hypothetical protein